MCLFFHANLIFSSVKESSTDSDSEHEEEFYYTEIEVNVENVTQGLSDMCTSSPSSPPERLYITDHDYQKKVNTIPYFFVYKTEFFFLPK